MNDLNSMERLALGLQYKYAWRSHPMHNATCFSENYRVEVSGWGRDGTFFVEKTELHPTETGSKKIVLHHPVRDGGFIFLSLLVTKDLGDTVPVAYQVKNMPAADGNGLSEVLLIELHPRMCGPA
jgi:hypothetical protein